MFKQWKEARADGEEYRALFVTESHTLVSEIERAFRAMQAAVLPDAEMAAVLEINLRLSAAPATLQPEDFRDKPHGACWPMFMSGQVGGQKREQSALIFHHNGPHSSFCCCSGTSLRWMRFSR